MASTLGNEDQLNPELDSISKREAASDAENTAIPRRFMYVSQNPTNWQLKEHDIDVCLETVS
ncbi:hypothetical protein TSMEX_005043 [Taenia solium]|eukprot:TsM_000731900 transcript=TsM_000731900 gene=TsM_000731900